MGLRKKHRHKTRRIICSVRDRGGKLSSGYLTKEAYRHKGEEVITKMEIRKDVSQLVSDD